MGNIIYITSVLLIIAWAVGFLDYNSGGLIHALLVIAAVAVILRLIQGKKVL